MQLARDFLEGVGFRKLGLQFLDLPTPGRVRARLQGTAGDVAFAAGLLRTEREAFFFAGEVVLLEPTPGSAGRNLQVKTPGICHPSTCLA